MSNSSKDRHIKDCKVAVMGGAGFLGSHLVNYLIDELGCEVLVIDNLCAGSKSFIHPKAHFVHHDITTSEEFLRKLFAANEIQFAFNYAAMPYIPVSFQRPLQVFNVNAIGAIKFINAAQESGVEAILQVSSAEIYGKVSGKIKESDRACPHSTYGTSKLAVDFFCQAAWRERQTPVISLRQFNCVGERDVLHPYIVPEIINQLKRNKHEPDGSVVVKLGNNSTRDFLYAGDAVRMSIELLEKGHFGEVYNLGSEQTISMYALAHMIGDIMGIKCKVEKDESRVRPWEIWHLQSCNDKLYEVIESRPLVDLKEALTRTITSLKSLDWKI